VKQAALLRHLDALERRAIGQRIWTGRMLAQLDGRQGDSLSPKSVRALSTVPAAAVWAVRFTSSVRLPLVAFRRHAAPDGVTAVWKVSRTR
jgi:hypothetical protein